MQWEYWTDWSPDRIIVAVWSGLTARAEATPVSQEACVLLLSLTTVLPTSRIAPMKLVDFDLERSVWFAPPRKNERSATVPLTRLSKALILRALDFRDGRGGGDLFPSQADAHKPVSAATLLRAFRRANIEPNIRRPGCGLAGLATWVLANEGADADDIRAAAHRKVDTRRISEIFDPHLWLIDRRRDALERLEVALMRIVDVNYSDPLFRGMKRFQGQGVHKAGVRPEGH
ncbi:hypothetical protein IB267_31650 [Ensifer sp. ENS09]|uniref:hypothetical protein n=1 Tax=Ensifer sp. ENS09 TaxID=2769263 RepID=UPI00177FA28A|nr:hypothetical protein [Ensifer sp. ENS09]MBD9652923.1 hypothetical protein [Ensifer sp. ENS09]